MVAQAAPPDEQGTGQPLPARRRDARTSCSRAGTRSRPAAHRGSQPATCPAPRSLPPAYDNTIPLDLIDVLVESDGAPFALADAAGRRGGRGDRRHALAYVRDGSTLQTGIGAIPNIVAAELAAGRSAGSASIRKCSPPGSCGCTRPGKVTNDAKGMFDGVSVTTFALGVSELYQWLDGNDEVAFLPVDTVNDPTIISRNANLVSINGALSVDLYGQVMADSIDGRQISGVGGHEDFVAGAELHLDAHSLICLRSTAVARRGGRCRASPGSRPRARSSPRRATTRASSSPSSARRS